MKNDIWGQPQGGLGYDGITTSLSKGKLREGNTVCENISMITSKVRVLKLDWLIGPYQKRGILEK